MNITKRFDPPTNDWSGRCNHCRSEATASLSEVRVTMNYCGEPISATAICPVCRIGTMTFRNTNMTEIAKLADRHIALTTKADA